LRAAPAHLESKLRFWDFSVGQIAAAFVGIMLGVAWAKFVSPLHGMWAAMSGAYIAALPVIPVFVASQTEVELQSLWERDRPSAPAPMRDPEREDSSRLASMNNGNGTR